MKGIQSLYFNGYKGFQRDDYATLKHIKNVNVIIGKNNSGKSSIIDVVEYINNLNDKKQIIFAHNIEADFLLDEACIEKGFAKNTSGGRVPGRNHYEYGKQFVNHVLRVTVHPSDQSRWSSSVNDNDFIQDNIRDNWNTCATNLRVNLLGNPYQHDNPFKQGNRFRKLAAERNIIPEEATVNLSLSADGLGATNLIRAYIQVDGKDESLIEKKLLSALNEIMYPDAEFERIQVQIINEKRERENELWEVFLQEKNEGRFPLSKSGSGLKTIILVLLNLLVVPDLNDYIDTCIVYGFEELENNLHPALQRRIFDYIYKYAIKKDAYIFLTTHSHVAINAFFYVDNAQIFHVTKEANRSNIQTITSHLENAKILNDLDARASDLLQSNGIIWVEGPSDRIYIKKWIEVFSTRNFEEGRDYQFMYYGGKILSHFTADMTEEEQEKYINILKTNRNAVIVMDSDRKNAKGNIRTTKTRVKNEFEKNGMLCWITKGKEIENYIPHSTVRTVFGKKIAKTCDIYESLADHIKVLTGKMPGSKIELANSLVEHINLDNADVLDVRLKIESICNAILGWNKTYSKPRPERGIYDDV